MAEPTAAGAATRKGAKKPLGWDIVLALLTAFTLMGYGVLCLYGMFHYKFRSAAPDWSVVAYQEMMNRLASPLTILLILWLVLCVPKRLLSRRALAVYCAATVAAALAVGAFGGIVLALGAALVLSSALQAVILVLVFTGARLRFSRRGLAVKIGSSLVHLGFLLFTLDLVLLELVPLRQSPWHLPLFWVATAFMTGGSALTFYFPRLRRGRASAKGGAAAAAALFLLLHPSLEAGAEGEETYRRVAEGKELFDRSCGICHPLPTLGRGEPAAGDWQALVGAMVDRGAKLTPLEASRIASFMSARSLFEVKCTVCHDKDKCLSRSKAREDWFVTVRRMKQMISGGLERDETEAITAYLAAVCPLPRDKGEGPRPGKGGGGASAGVGRPQ